MEQFFEGQKVYHPLYGKTTIDCIPLHTAFRSAELGNHCYLAQTAGGHDPWVLLSELISR